MRTKTKIKAGSWTQPQPSGSRKEPREPTRVGVAVKSGIVAGVIQQKDDGNYGGAAFAST
jgi:hypothetical protein